MDANFFGLNSILTTLINFIAAFLIVKRIRSFQRNLQTLGLGPSPYTALMEIWVESAALIVLFNLVYLGLTFVPPSHPPVSFIFMQCLIHINVRVHNLLLAIGWKIRQSYVCLKY